jgi:hypothetical protein
MRGATVVKEAYSGNSIEAEEKVGGNVFWWREEESNVLQETLRVWGRN